ncbi:MAG: TMEM175 family protein [Atopobiaceae bacterium]|jgi:uncharacterized membrane protein
MSKSRLEAFSDGVLAIIITIMVLEMSAPTDASFSSLLEVVPTFIGYVVSYTYIGIYWVNHHRLLVRTDHVCGRALWANLLWMFFVSLIPFATAWASNTGFAPAPVFFYSLVILLSAFGYQVLDMTIRHAQGTMDNLFTVIFKTRKNLLTVIGYALCLALSFIFVPATYVLYILIAILWIMPDVEQSN